MSCKSTKCIVCGGSFPGCQIVNGKCGACRAKEKQTVPAPVPAPAPVKK